MVRTSKTGWVGSIRADDLANGSLERLHVPARPNEQDEIRARGLRLREEE